MPWHFESFSIILHPRGSVKNVDYTFSTDIRLGQKALSAHMLYYTSAEDKEYTQMSNVKVTPGVVLQLQVCLCGGYLSVMNRSDPGPVVFWHTETPTICSICQIIGTENGLCCISLFFSWESSQNLQIETVLTGMKSENVKMFVKLVCCDLIREHKEA